MLYHIHVFFLLKFIVMSKRSLVLSEYCNKTTDKKYSVGLNTDFMRRSVSQCWTLPVSWSDLPVILLGQSGPRVQWADFHILVSCFRGGRYGVKFPDLVLLGYECRGGARVCGKSSPDSESEVWCWSPTCPACWIHVLGQVALTPKLQHAHVEMKIMILISLRRTNTPVNHELNWKSESEAKVYLFLSDK